jgi:hypothetical protein
MANGILLGMLLGEVWGYLEGILRWMDSHEYQVVKAIHGTLNQHTLEVQF